MQRDGGRGGEGKETKILSGSVEDGGIEHFILTNMNAAVLCFNRLCH